MGMDRRGFLKLAGVASVVGVGGTVGGAKVLTAAAQEGTPEMRRTGPELEGKRWAMVVDVSKCMKDKGCTRCIAACHEAHNVPDLEDEKEEIKWIWREGFHGSFPEQDHEFVATELHHYEFPLLCNHCDNPSCVRVWPTRTTWAREDGVVMMDMHRCIGCRYCINACPYGARSFNWRDPRPQIADIDPDFPTRTRGVVEKCNFCAEQIARGLQPHCIEACEAGAMAFGDLEDPKSSVRKLLHDNFSVRRKPSIGTQPQVYYLV